MPSPATPPSAPPRLYRTDLRVFLALIPAINLINYYLTYDHIPSGWRLPVTFLIDTTQGYAAWWAARAIIRWLDHQLPYEQAPAGRILLQTGLTTLAGVAVIALTTEFVNFLASDKPVPRAFYTHHLFIFAIWFLVVNGIYVGLHFFYQYQQATQRPTAAESLPTGAPLRTEGFVVRSGRQTVQLGYPDITGFYVDGDYTLVCTRDGRHFVVDASLDKLEPDLPADWFFRANRQYLLQRHTITGFDRIENGKLLLRLKPDNRLPESVAVSRTKAPAFKKWFGAEQAI